MTYEFLYDETATEDEVIAGYQELINTAMDLIEAGHCVLGEEGHRDYYGNYVPSRYEVEAGTKGSVEYAEARRDEE